MKATEASYNVQNKSILARRRRSERTIILADKFVGKHDVILSLLSFSFHTLILKAELIQKHALINKHMNGIRSQTLTT